MLGKHLSSLKKEKIKKDEEEVRKFFKYLFEVELGEKMEELTEKGSDRMVVKPSHKLYNKISEFSSKYYDKYFLRDVVYENFGIMVKNCSDDHDIIFLWE